MEMKGSRLTGLYFKIFPEIIMHHHTYRLKCFVRSMAVGCDQKGKKIIDIGAGDCQYKGYFRKAQYFSQDIQENLPGTVDYLGQMDTLPSNFFDYVLCTQVLEHLKEPSKAFKNFYRILKKGGKVFLTTHMAFEEHLAPSDYFRFTRYGLKYLAQSNGFRVEKITPQGGRFIVLGKELQTLFPRIIKNKYLVYIFYLLFSLPLFLLNLILVALDFLDKDKTLTLNYECIFTKKF
jgi:SAM-dependent methyltransferase